MSLVPTFVSWCQHSFPGANICFPGANIRRERTYPELSPPPPFKGGNKRGSVKMYCSTHPTPASQPAGRTGHLTTPPPPPSPLPTWAKVARGGSSRGETGDQTRARPPTAYSSTPTHPAHSNTYTGSPQPPLHPPCAHSQYLAWVRCRRAGIPARLVLETDGCTEDVTLWFRPSAVGGGEPVSTDTQAHALHSGKRRRERARRARRREERREARERCLPPATPTTGKAAKMAEAPSPSPQEEPPPEPPTSAASTIRARGCKARPLIVKKAKAALAASRASQRAAALAKRRGAAASRNSAASDVSPEKLRGDGEDTPFNITDVDAEGAAGGVPSLDQTPEDNEELHAR